MAQSSNAGKHARGGGWGGFLGLFFLILVVELVLDVVLLPADVVIVPAELIGDALFLAVGVGGAFVAGRGTGRPIRPPPRSSRPLQGNRRAIADSGGALVLGYWTFVVAILLFQWWWAVHHPILDILTLPFEVVFDVLLFVGGILVTLSGLGGRSSDSREVGS